MEMGTEVIKTGWNWLNAGGRLKLGRSGWKEFMASRSSERFGSEAVNAPLPSHA